MASPDRSWRGPAGRRTAAATLVVMIVVAGLFGAVVSGAFGSPRGSGHLPASAGVPASGGPAASGGTAPSGTPSSDPGSTARPGRTAGPSPTPGEPLVPAPLTGLLVPQSAALRHPIAVMVDDHVDARPQAGFNAAAVVWHAPAESGIPRYMLVFQDRIPASVGPVRSARQYFIDWAAEYNALYVHAGGSPQALETLRRFGRGQLVWNGDDFRWEGTYLWRVHADGRFAPHNVFTDGNHLRALGEALGMPDGPVDRPWTFRPPRIDAERPVGGKIVVTYPYESITYRYDALTDTYLRSINGSKRPQIDDADGRAVAPRNVVVLRMRFGPLNDGHPEKFRLEADDIGSGVAWIATGGRTVKGTWRKDSVAGPTRLFGPDGRPIVLSPGQTFVQVLPLSYGLSVSDAPAAPVIGAGGVVRPGGVATGFVAS